MRRSGWLIAAVAAGLLTMHTGGIAQAADAAGAGPQATTGEPLGTLSGDGVEVQPRTDMAARLDRQGRLEVPDGARIVLRGPAARLRLSRGGEVSLCGPARVSLTRGGRQALLIGLAEGALELRYAAGVADVWLTPDFRITTVVPPKQLAAVSASLAVKPGGTICLMNRGSALSVVRLLDGQQHYVINGQSYQFSPAGAIEAVPSCPCATAAPEAVPAPNRGPAVLFPSAPALQVEANATPAVSEATTAAPSSAPPSPHHNFLVRFLRWLVGK